MARISKKRSKALLNTLREVGATRLRKFGRDFDEFEFLMGAAAVIGKIFPGPVDPKTGQELLSPVIPPAWVLLLPVGRSWVDPDGEIGKSLGFIDCAFCNRPAEREHGMRNLDGDRLCHKCYKEEYDR